MAFRRVQVIGWVDEGEIPPGLPEVPGYPGQGLPIYPGQPLPPSWGRPPYPGQGLPPGWAGRPGYPGQPLPWPGRPVDPGWGVDEGEGGGGGIAAPKAYGLGNHPDEPGGAGTWAVVIYEGEARWVFVPLDEEPEVEPERTR
jgi:hypothetical protein